MANIEDLSKQELLGLIYHLVPSTHYKDHPCFCACCGDDYDKEKEYDPKPYWYLCDKCQDNLSDDNNFVAIKETKCSNKNIL